MGGSGEIEKKRFSLRSSFKPAGDQPAAIDELTAALSEGRKYNVLLGVTGSGKTFTIANVIERLQRPAIIISHNKTLAAQLYAEFKEFFPENRVEFFVSYYDYYQPEAYLPGKDMYIEKDCDINQEIDRLRHSATHSILTRRDTIIVASVSCIYGLGSPELYERERLVIRKGDRLSRDSLLLKLVGIMYERNDIVFEQGKFRVKGDIVDVFPMYEEHPYRFELFGDEIEKISIFDPLSGHPLAGLDETMIYPAKHYLIETDKMNAILKEIRGDMDARSEEFRKEGKLLEAQRIAERVNYDIEMLQVMHYTKGIENYSRYFDGREEGTPPVTLLDYLPDDVLYIIDESHVTVPQLRGMYNGDRKRKQNLVDYGFRLPAAYDNRPLKFEEFFAKMKEAVFVSATPSDYELDLAEGRIIEQIVRPTGLIDPQITVHPTAGQIEKLLDYLEPVLARNEKALITTLTKKMAEDLSAHLGSLKYRVKYLHSDIDTIERYNIIKMLRTGEIDIIVGVNLLREGLDLPEVSLVAIFDADKEGFLRSRRSLIQTIGRTARNVNGQVVLFADIRTDSIELALSETERRRMRQIEYNKEHGIVPRTVVSSIKSGIEKLKKKDFKSDDDLDIYLKDLKRKMERLAKELRFEEAAEIREEIIALRKSFLFGEEKGK